MSAPTHIGHYRLGDKLGEGGMGAVYRALDTRLNRDVAIKLLPDAFARDAARMQRFEREAQILATLNHPNIAAIYGVEQGAIVMELVEGEDLKGPVPAETALDYARQIAAGLEAAHEKGIVHRDLKPANIRLTPGGAIKILDFGLAKAADEPAAAVAANPTVSPTLSLSMTRAGMILGTAAYMSPEQARGKPVDRRADIWAFGVVLYELLTGRLLFGGGETASDALAAVLARDPDWSALPADTPARVRALLQRCLRRDPKQRLRDIGDARLILEEAEPPAPAAPTGRAWLPWAVAAIAVAAAVAAIVLLPSAKPDAGPGAARFQFAYPAGTGPTSSRAAAQAVPSPDGRNIAFVAMDPATGVEFLWVRPLAGAPYRLDRTEGANLPFWSPDGQHIAFFTKESLKRVPLSGGAVQSICPLDKDATVAVSGDGGSWSSDGAIAFARLTPGPILRVPAGGGIPAPLTALEPDEGRHSWPQFLPGGRLLFHARNVAESAGATVIQNLATGRRVRVLQNPIRTAWSPPGFLLFVRDGNLLAQALDLDALRLTGDPLPVTEGVAANEVNGRGAFAVSQNGVLAFAAAANGLRQLAWYDRAGKRLAAVGAPGFYQHMTLSPDGRSVALIAGPIGRLDLWVMDVATGLPTRLTRTAGLSVAFPAVWSPDSRSLAVTYDTGTVRIVTIASGKSTPLPAEFGADAWTPDSRALLCNDKSNRRLGLCPVDGGPPATVIEFDTRSFGFRLSPDGKHVAYTADEGGIGEVYVAEFPGFAVKRKVSAAGGIYPMWAANGKELFYRSSSGTMTAAQVRTSPSLAVDAPRPLFRFGVGTFGNRFAVSPDGSRFLINEYSTESGAQVEINVAVDWRAGFR